MSDVKAAEKKSKFIQIYSASEPRRVPPQELGTGFEERKYLNAQHDWVIEGKKFSGPYKERTLRMCEHLSGKGIHCVFLVSSGLLERILQALAASKMQNYTLYSYTIGKEEPYALLQAPEPVEIEPKHRHAISRRTGEATYAS